MDDQAHGACNRLEPVFDLLGKRWTGLVLGALMEGPARFSELARTIDGVSERMLTERLNELGDVGLVERHVLPGPPVGVEYRLTERGKALEPALDALAAWAEDHLAEDR
ncbi:winged helix-turn-helix transcriptional regulator [Dermatobacter hominis]|uniref:winged helix-turn-helix transcriptional regulator n=1 Tax=Dermatobacter hominis TaxID=2884263 RepID=UPI001D10A10A|nr:helix-turn-helix domain-containing protein [Dermatobacter hominis]UDY34430.1 helix-turn-helix transcriptional regulator [Dermatobacter hominis]